MGAAEETAFTEVEHEGAKHLVAVTRDVSGDRLVKVISFDAHGETHTIPLGIEVPYKYVKAMLDWVDFRDAIVFAPLETSPAEVAGQVGAGGISDSESITQPPAQGESVQA